MTILHIHFNVVAVYLQYILQTSWSVHSVYTTTILPYTESLLHFGLGIDKIFLWGVYEQFYEAFTERGVYENLLPAGGGSTKIYS